MAATMHRPADASAPNTLGFDLEHWHSATLLADAVDDPLDRVEASVEVVLSLLEAHDVEATFFVVGALAEEYPELLCRIHAAGHELASHGHTHTPLFELTPESFASELRRSAAAIERATGVEPVGFRAPNFSVTPETEWALEVLAESDYRYDSSVFPVRTPMYGVGGAPLRPYTVPAADPFRTPEGDERVRDLLEVPMSVAGPLARVPIAGGFYARLLPAAVLERAIGRLRRCGRAANLYFHPWEFNDDVVRGDLPLHRRFVSFHGIERLEPTLDRLLERFEWGPVAARLDADALQRPPVGAT